MQPIVKIIKLQSSLICFKIVDFKPPCIYLLIEKPKSVLIWGKIGRVNKEDVENKKRNNYPIDPSSATCMS